MTGGASTCRHRSPRRTGFRGFASLLTEFLPPSRLTALPGQRGSGAPARRGRRALADSAMRARPLDDEEEPRERSPYRFPDRRSDAAAALPAQHHAPRRRARPVHGGGLRRPLHHRPRRARAAGPGLHPGADAQHAAGHLLRAGGAGVLHPGRPGVGRAERRHRHHRLHRLAGPAAAHRGRRRGRLRRRRHRDVGHLALPLLREHGPDGGAGPGRQRGVRRLLRLGDQHRLRRRRLVQHPPRLLQLGLRLPHQPLRGGGHRGPAEQLPRDLGRALRRRQDAEGDGQAVRAGARPEPGRPAELRLPLHVGLRRDGGRGGRHDRRHQQAGVRRGAAGLHPALDRRLRRDRALLGRRRQQPRLPLRPDLRHAQRQQRLPRRRRRGGRRLDPRLRSARRARRHLARGLPVRSGRPLQRPGQPLHGGHELLGEHRGGGRSSWSTSTRRRSSSPGWRRRAATSSRWRRATPNTRCTPAIRGSPRTRRCRTTAATRAMPARPTRRPRNRSPATSSSTRCAQAIQSGDAAGAVQQAEAQLQRIYGAERPSLSGPAAVRAAGPVRRFRQP